MKPMEGREMFLEETQEDQKLKKEREVNTLFSELLKESEASEVGTLQERFWKVWKEKFSSIDAVQKTFPTLFKEAEENEKKFLKETENMGETGEVWDADEETQVNILLDEIKKDFVGRLENLTNLK